CPDAYCNDAWDLVDAIRTGRCKMDDLKDEDLPKEMRGLSQAQRKARVDEMNRKRDAIQKKIARLNSERETYLAAERKKRAADAKETLDSAIVKAIREQAARLDYRFE